MLAQKSSKPNEKTHREIVFPTTSIMLQESFPPTALFTASLLILIVKINIWASGFGFAFKMITKQSNKQTNELEISSVDRILLAMESSDGFVIIYKIVYW